MPPAVRKYSQIIAVRASVFFLLHLRFRHDFRKVTNFLLSRDVEAFFGSIESTVLSVPNCVLRDGALCDVRLHFMGFGGVFFALGQLGQITKTLTWLEKPMSIASTLFSIFPPFAFRIFPHPVGVFRQVHPRSSLAHCCTFFFCKFSRESCVGNHDTTIPCSSHD